MTKEVSISKKHGVISYTALFIGIVCFFIVFVEPTKIANVGYLIGDTITFFLTGAGIILSVIGLVKKTKKNILPMISLILSSSFIAFWIITIFLLFTGKIPFGP
ncbi:hypothetical protein [Sporosarcina pasteurii]|uniref:Uncharacterized protein n=1 Tax=Sporosarcina pasteurii TaxID=1474 RepID=A0A380CDN5_SPOPA|nr:hypothetical protein [Sporosarcina pasteurii]MDS9473214.1 hypothetical protein [Sporosarcina pasteurii]QBQ06947.1 hypothetical protein E2C16_15485 [Sporosarcina pasteurii]SUJ18377.1 Uncharacterised protein [Sporosarcina pasteurii]